MGYATTGEVVTHLPGRYFFETDAAGKTVVTVSDLEAFIETSAWEVNALLQRLGFSLPVMSSTSPSGYCILAKLNALGAAALAEEAWCTAKGEISERAKRLKERYDKMLTEIAEHELDLVDVDGGPATPEALSDSGALDTDEAGNERPIFFERSMSW